MNCQYVAPARSAAPKTCDFRTFLPLPHLLWALLCRSNSRNGTVSALPCYRQPLSNSELLSFVRRLRHAGVLGTTKVCYTKIPRMGERVQISSVAEFWKLLVRVLERLWGDQLFNGLARNATRDRMRGRQRRTSV